ncbi:nucleotide exchange factor GrpE [Oligoflexus tunisiensis]|uniref:nucleotide exchange factor GrpE n=1 Tax=Oligoflexus tunisiensis TaxID=708132 RepID=UPI000A6DE77C|nr:nucleotide exchange factor GrpE [Oligoflexus tunisiensis]
MKDLILIKTYPGRTEADQLRDFLLEHGVAAVIVANKTPRSGNDETATTEFFDVRVPAVDVAKTISLLTPAGVNPLPADEFVDMEDVASSTEANLLAEVNRLQEKLADMTDKYLRACADIENMRRRHERELQQNTRFSLENLFKDVIPVLDGFDKALPAEDAVGPQFNRNEIEKTFYQGMVQLKDQLAAVFRKHGLKEIDASGAFDPNVHHAIKTLESHNVEADTVGEEYARGYTLNERVLRPAMVSVVTRKTETEPEKSGAKPGTSKAAEDERTLH